MIYTTDDGRSCVNKTALSLSIFNQESHVPKLRHVTIIYVCMCAFVFVDHCLATEVFIGKLPAT